MRKIIVWIVTIIGACGVFYSVYNLPTVYRHDESGIPTFFLLVVILASLTLLGFGTVTLSGKMTHAYEVMFTTLAIISFPIIIAVALLR